MREFPDHVTTHSAAGMAQAMRTRMKGARERRVSRSTEQPAADVTVEALERLAKLREAGVLSDDEFAAEKRRVLAYSSEP
jgi:hypothetical protein